MWPLIYRIKVSPKRYVSKQMKGSYNKIHGYTVQQQYPTLYYPTNANNVKNVELLKHFKIRKNVPTCFGLQGNHHQGATVST